MPGVRIEWHLNRRFSRIALAKRCFVCYPKKKEKEHTMGTKAILFDLDGTLTDSGEGIINCATLALEHLGLPVPSREEMRVFVGPPLDETFRKFGVPADKTEEAIAVFRSRYTPIGKYENTPYPGIRELLEALTERGYRLYVATSKPEVMARDILEHFALDRYFTRICGATLDGTRVVKEAVIAYLLEQSGTQGDMVMVGDTLYDILGAKAHGIPGIGVSWGYGKVSEMVEAGAAAIADTPQQLLEILEA